jgi:putative ABC transport system permease protein
MQGRRRVSTPREEAAAEIEAHLAMRVEALVAAGWSETAARREAERRFGNAREVRTAFQRSMRRRHRRARRREVASVLWNSLGYAARQLRRAPVFTLAVIASLGVAIGANATMFRIVDRLLLRAPEYLRVPERVNRIFFRFGYPDLANEVITPQAGYERYLDLAAGLESFDAVAAVFTSELTVGEGREAQARPVMLATPSFWRLFDAPPELGRYFTEAENALPRGDLLAVLSYGEWRTRFGGARDVLGRTLRIGSGTYTIIGVAPRSFTGLDPSPVTAFVPMAAAGVDVMGAAFALDFTGTWLEIVARRRPEAMPQAAENELTLAVQRSYFARNPRASPEVRVSALLTPILRDRGPYASAGSKVAVWLAGVAAIVLLIACANVANLLLVRTLERRREIAVRVALGAGRLRMLVQQLTEGLLLAALGGGLGLLLAWSGGAFIQRGLVPDVDWSGGRADGRVLLFTLVATLLTGIVVSILPMIRGLHVTVSTEIRSSGRLAGAGSSRARMALVLVQALLSMMLLSGAGLFVQSLRNARSVDLGFDPDRILYARVTLQGSGLDNDQVGALLEGVRESPGGGRSRKATAKAPCRLRW